MAGDSGAPLIEQVLAPFVRFSRIAASGGLVLVACAAAALYFANSGFADDWFALWKTPLTVGFGEFVLSKPLLLWINDGLMAVFFFLVGLEIKREALAGELSSPGQAFLPIAAAIGGMVVPAAIYAALNYGQETIHGWGVPMATDIAFALGVLALLGDRVPAGLKVFLAAVAIVDDIGAVLVIAIFYASDISMLWLASGLGVFALMLAFNAAGARHPLGYLLLGMVMWLFFLKSGVHATVAGVLAAMAIPARTRIRPGEFVIRAQRLLERFERSIHPGRGVLTSPGQLAVLDEMEEVCAKANAPLPRIEHALAPWAAFFVMPVFALANAGVPITASAAEILAAPEALGIFLGLVIGKQAGIFLTAAVLFRLGLARMQQGLSLSQYYGASCMAGIGFTMSIFIAGLAFDEGGAFYAQAKLAVLAASAVAALAGWLVLRLSGRDRTPAA